MWIVKRSRRLSPADIRKNVTRLRKSLESDTSFPPMATLYVQVLVDAKHETTRLLGGHLSLHTDDLERAKDLTQLIYEALSQEASRHDRRSAERGAPGRASGG
jgi:hypothetical protein